jgi:hypothetical protein
MLKALTKTVIETAVDEEMSAAPGLHGPAVTNPRTSDRPSVTGHAVSGHHTRERRSEEVPGQRGPHFPLPT